jgi:hypothetical protein
MFLYQKINMARMESFNSFQNVLFIFFLFSALHRLSHHAESGDIFPVTGELIEDKSIRNKEEPIVLQRRKRRAFRT